MYPNILGKKYINISTNQTVGIKEQDNDIITLDDGSIVSIALILNKNVYDEYIDPALFFQNEKTLNMLSSKILSIPDEHLNQLPLDDPESTAMMLNEGLANHNKDFYPQSNESMIIADDPNYEYNQLQEKIRMMGYNTSPVNAVEAQTNTLLNLIGEGEAHDAQTTVRMIDEPVTYNHAPTPVHYEQKTQHVSAPAPDPITVMFNGAKRNVEFNFNIPINKLIPRLEFIDIMEDSYERSIIEYLANEFTQELLDNPVQIREIIEEGIRKMVYGDAVKTPPAEKTPVENPIAKPTKSAKIKEIIKETATAEKKSTPARRRAPKTDKETPKVKTSKNNDVV